MAASSLDALRETQAVQVEWRAFELRPPGSPPLPPEYRTRILAGWPRVQQIAQERFGVRLKRPELTGETVGVSRLAHVGAKFAARQGLGEAYHHALFSAYWQAERDIAAPETLTAIAQELGMEAGAFQAALHDPDLLAEVEADEYWAYQQSLNGVPAFIFGNRYLISGAQTAEVLRQVADKCIEEGRVL